MKKKRQEDSEEYVCPMDVEMPKGQSFQKGFRGMELHIYEDDLDRLEQVKLLEPISWVNLYTKATLSFTILLLGESMRLLHVLTFVFVFLTFYCCFFVFVLFFWFVGFVSFVLLF